MPRHSAEGVGTVRVLKTDADLRKRFSELRLRRDLFRKPEGFFRKSEGFFRDSGGFFRRRGRLLPKMRKASSADAEGSEFRSDQYLRSYVDACWFSWGGLTLAILSKYVQERVVSLKESSLTNREVVETLKREGATVIRVTMHVATNAILRLAALTGEKDLEGRPCAPVPFWRPSKR